MSEERSERLPALDGIKVSLYAAEATKHDCVPRVGDAVQVRLSVDRPDGLTVWDETLVVEGLIEKPGDCGAGSAEIEISLERRDDD